jgi:hypothetical protein
MTKHHLATRRRPNSGYRFSIRWIAANDECSEMDPTVLADLISVQLIADLYRKAPEAVAEDVVRERMKSCS